MTIFKEEKNASTKADRKKRGIRKHISLDREHLGIFLSEAQV